MPTTFSVTAPHDPVSSVNTLLLDCRESPAPEACLRAAGPAARLLSMPVRVLGAPSDGLRAAMTRHCPQAEYMAVDAALSSGDMLNLALARCKGNVVFVRGLCLPESLEGSWLVALLEAAARHPEAGIVAARTVTMDGRIVADGHVLVSALGLHHPQFLRRHLEDDGFESELAVDSADLDVAFIRREALKAVAASYGSGFANALAASCGVQPCAADMVVDPLYDTAGLMDDDLAFAVRAAGFGVCVTSRVRAVRLAPSPLPEGAQVGSLEAAFERETALKRTQVEYWARKWQWDPLLPDVGRLRRLFGHTPVCWNTGEALRWKSAEPYPTVDLCMVTWNGAAHLERCLQSLAATRYPADRLTLYLIDNAGTDDSPALLERLVPTLPFTVHRRRLAVNVGGVAGMNWAMAEGTGELVAKLDDDIIVPPDWLERLVAVFAKRPWAGVTGPRIVDDTPTRRLQCADYACQPMPVTHEQEPDEGQTNAMARVIHVRGCCNLYRRDAIRRCGPLDIRYSPSQWDDPDHQLALLAAGYEVIHEGGVAVAHKMTTGSVSSGLSLANASLNRAKMLVKWGQGASELLESALLLSDEGRYVEPWAASSAASSPPVSAGPLPCPPTPDFVQHLAEHCAACRLCPEDSAALHRALHAQARQLVRQAAESRLAGREAMVLPQLRAATSCAPHDPLIVLALAEALADNDAVSKATLLRQRAVALWVREEALPSARVFPPLPRGASRPRDLATPAPGSRVVHGVHTPHALWCIPHSRRLDTALGALLGRAAQALEAQGWRVTLDSAPCPRLADAGQASFDVAHCWTLDAPHESLAQIKALATLRPQLPRLLTPLRDDPAEHRWLALLATHLRQHGSLEALPPWPAETADDPLAQIMRRQILGLAHGVLPRHRLEAMRLGLDVASPACRLVASEPLRIPYPADPRLFREASGLDEFVLAVAPITVAAGQAQLLAALAPTGLPVVLVGDAPEAWYLHLCRRLMPSCLFVSEAEPELLASAFAAARVHALPALASLGEAAALTAARFGKPVVAAQGSPEAQSVPIIPCSPCEVSSITAAVRRAWHAGPTRAMTQEPLTLRLETVYAGLMGEPEEATPPRRQHES